MIKLCPNCIPNEFQDRIYGKNRRVMNECKKGLACRCTVCGKEQSFSSAEVKNRKLEEKDVKDVH